MISLSEYRVASPCRRMRFASEEAVEREEEWWW